MQVPGTQHRSLGPDKETMFDNEMHGEESFDTLLNTINDGFEIKN